jgi:lambda family phage portal protein
VAPAPRPSRVARVLDRALGAVGLARSSRVASPTRGRGVYAGAAVSRLTSDWIAAPMSADRAIRGDLRLLRDRSRQLVRDNAYAQRYVDMQAENIIGPDGIKLQCLIRGADGKTLDLEANRAIEAAFDDWALPEHASVDGLLSLTEIAALAVQAWKQDGEALIRLWDGFPNKHGFALQVLDADLLDHTLDRAPAEGVNEIRMGVERDQWGRPVAYHLWTRHPQDVHGTVQTRERVPAADVVHLYTVRRPGQTRGVPAFACVMADLNMLAGYQEAELVAARTAAAQMFFITQEADAAGVDPDPDGETEIPTEAEPGTGWKLGPGESVEQFDPQHPVAAFGAFVKSIMRAIAAGLGVSYSALTGDLESVNYSSIRDGSLKERDAYKRAQRWISLMLYRRAYLRWLRMAQISGAVPVQHARAAAAAEARGAAHRWLARGWPWIDPEKDIRAAALEVAHGFNTRSDVCAANGRDHETVLEGLAREQKLADKHGVTLATAEGAAAPAAPAESGGASSAGADDEADEADEADDATTARPKRAPVRVAA